MLRCGRRSVVVCSWRVFSVLWLYCLCCCRHWFRCWCRCSRCLLPVVVRVFHFVCVGILRPSSSTCTLRLPRSLPPVTTLPTIARNYVQPAGHCRRDGRALERFCRSADQRSSNGRRMLPTGAWRHIAGLVVFQIARAAARGNATTTKTTTTTRITTTPASYHIDQSQHSANNNRDNRNNNNRDDKDNDHNDNNNDNNRNRIPQQHNADDESSHCHTCMGHAARFIACSWDCGLSLAQRMGWELVVCLQPGYLQLAFASGAGRRSPNVR